MARVITVFSRTTHGETKHFPTYIDALFEGGGVSFIFLTLQKWSSERPDSEIIFDVAQKGYEKNAPTVTR